MRVSARLIDGGQWGVIGRVGKRWEWMSVRDWMVGEWEVCCVKFVRFGWRYLYSGRGSARGEGLVGRALV